MWKSVYTDPVVDIIFDSFLPHVSVTRLSQLSQRWRWQWTSYSHQTAGRLSSVRDSCSMTWPNIAIKKSNISTNFHSWRRPKKAGIFYYYYVRKYIYITLVTPPPPPLSSNYFSRLSNYEINFSLYAFNIRNCQITYHVKIMFMKYFILLVKLIPKELSLIARIALQESLKAKTSEFSQIFGRVTKVDFVLYNVQL